MPEISYTKFEEIRLKAEIERQAAWKDSWIKALPKIKKSIFKKKKVKKT